MGLPEITINFHKKAQNLIRRSSRGMVIRISQLRNGRKRAGST